MFHVIPLKKRKKVPALPHDLLLLNRAKISQGKVIFTFKFIFIFIFVLDYDHRHPCFTYI